MKAIGKYLMLLTALVALSATSCVNDELPERQDIGAGKIAALEEQAAAIEASLADIEALQTALGEGRDAGLDKSAAALEDHVAALRDGAPYMDATMATLAYQKTLAEAVGTLLASDEDGTLAKHAADLEKGVKAWLGKHLTAYYPAAVARAEAVSRMSGLDLRTQKLNVEAVLSDVEAGLSEYEDEEGLAALAAKVSGNCDEAEALAAELSALTEEVEAEYTQVVETVVSEPENFDAAALKQFNSAVRTKASEAAVTLADLIARVEECETTLADILAAVESLESKVEDLEELLGMIQSVTFMSRYSEEKAVAYYSLGSEDAPEGMGPEGAKNRNSEGNIELDFVVRPASAASALTSSELWNSGLTVFGYYADQITKSASDLSFKITGVQAKENGIVTLTVGNPLSEAFFFRQTGAKLALSLATGKTDLTTRFVEIVPKDRATDAGTVYVETLTLSRSSFEIDNGQQTNLSVTLTPDNVTTGSVRWTSSDNDVATVSSDGLVIAKSVGDVVITATSDGIDEWGRKLVKTCSIKVNPSVRLSGPTYVEQGGQIEIRIESPDYINPDLITWSITGAQYQAYATVTKTGNGSGMVYGNAMWFDESEKAYKAIPVTCTIAGAMPITLTHEIRVIANQPKSIAIEGLSYDQNTLPPIKKGSEFTINASCEPAGVDPSRFRIVYQSSAPGVADVDFSSGHVEGRAFGTAFIDVKVIDSGNYNYFYPARTELVRQVAVTVEPYWIEEVKLIAPEKINVGAQSKIEVELTSDVSGVDPTYTNLVWSSSNPDVAEVDEYGNVTAKAEGPVTITAITPEGAVKNGGTITKTCQIAVMTASNPVEVGYYYYSDGTWGESASPSGKSVIGVIFSTINAYSHDAALKTDGKTDCVRGLVVGLNEVTGQYVQLYNGSRNDKINKMKELGYDPSNETIANGYGNTKGYPLANAAIPDNDVVIKIHESATGYGVTAPDKSSGWYVPSLYEMQVLHSACNVVNTKLSDCDGTQLNTSGKYWTSSCNYDNGYYCYYFSPFDMGSCYFTKYYGGYVGNDEQNVQFPVRVVLAF